MFTYAIDRGYPVELARTIAVNTIVVMEVFHLFFVRNIYGTSLTLSAVAGTPAVWLSVAIIVVGQFAITYVPFLQGLFGHATGIPSSMVSRSSASASCSSPSSRSRSRSDCTSPRRSGRRGDRPGHHTSLMPTITAAAAITHSATRPQRAGMGLGAADFGDRFGIETNSALAHPVHLGRQPLGPLGEARQLGDQPAERADAFRRQLELAGGAEVALDPVARPPARTPTTCRSPGRASAPRPRPPPSSSGRGAVRAASACRRARSPRRAASAAAPSRCRAPAGRGSARRWRGAPGRSRRPNAARRGRSPPRNAPRRRAGSRGG